MEYLVYANMVLANEGKTIDTEYHLPQLKFNWKKGFKSAWLNFASIGALLAILAQTQIASAYYVSTNGSCLNVRTGPGLDYPVTDCVSNGESLLPVVRYANGFAELSSGNWVSAEWISSTPGNGYYPASYGGYGVGGEYPEYFRHHYYHHYHYYGSSYYYPRYRHHYYGSSYYYPRYRHHYYGSSYYYPRYRHHYYGSSYYYPRYHHNYYRSSYY